jgi:hypothetical protein
VNFPTWPLRLASFILTTAASAIEQIRAGDVLQREKIPHAACLSIAQGAPGWEKEFLGEYETPATAEVRKLRRQFEQSRAHCLELMRKLTPQSEPEPKQ